MHFKLPDQKLKLYAHRGRCCLLHLLQCGAHCEVLTKYNNNIIIITTTTIPIIILTKKKK